MFCDLTAVTDLLRVAQMVKQRRQVFSARIFLSGKIWENYERNEESVVKYFCWKFLKINQMSSVRDPNDFLALWFFLKQKRRNIQYNASESVHNSAISQILNLFTKNKIRMEYITLLSQIILFWTYFPRKC